MKRILTVALLLLAPLAVLQAAEESATIKFTGGPVGFRDFSLTPAVVGNAVTPP